MYLIGIDPGKDTGLAVWCKKRRKLVHVWSADFWEALEVMAAFDPKTVRVHIENPNFNAPTFGKAHLDEENQRTVAKVSQDVGRNKAHAQLLIDYARTLGLEVVAVKPGKHTKSKTPADKFKRITGWRGRTNEHARDAAMLVYGF